MKEIELSQDFVALVDDEDFEWLSQYKWHVRRSGRTFYATRYFRVFKGYYSPLWMHREIMRCPWDMQVDHINHNNLDNQKSNLRICNHQQNHWNQKLSINSTSGYKGASWDASRGMWLSSITLDRRHVHLGYHFSKESAALAYNRAAIKLFGDFAFLNDVF